MCERRASFAVNCNGVEGACDEHEVLLIGLLTRLGSNCGQSCEQVTVCRSCPTLSSTYTLGRHSLYFLSLINDLGLLPLASFSVGSPGLSSSLDSALSCLSFMIGY